MNKGRAAARVEGLIRSHKVDGRCIYDKSAKEQLARACLEPGISVAASALANGVNANLLRKWIEKFERKRAPMRGALTPNPPSSTLLPVKITEAVSVVRSRARARKSKSSTLTTHTTGRIELDYHGIRVIVRGAVNPQQLQHVLTSIKRAR